VRENTSAVIARNFVTGIAQIRLVTPEPSGPPLTNVPEGERFPVIAEGRSDVSEITGRVTELGDMAGDAIQRINQLLSVENRAAAAATLGNVRQLTETLKKELVGIDRSIAEIAGAAREVRRAAGGAAAAVERVGQGASVALDDTRALIGDLRATTVETQRAVTQVSAAIVALQGDTSRTARRVDATVAQLDDQMLAAVNDLRASLETMQRSLDRLGDPRTALLGPEPSRLGPGEKLR
jgi:phospholipid/cholesterol/gamma-HCH transport system substrate-binding protein